MPWFTKKERRRQVSAFPAIFKADFGRFRYVSAVFSRIGCIGRRSIRPDMVESAWFGANRSRFGTNRATSARNEPSRREFEKKKKKHKRGRTRVRYLWWCSHLFFLSLSLEARLPQISQKFSFSLVSQFSMGGFWSFFIASKLFHLVVEEGGNFFSL